MNLINFDKLVAMDDGERNTWLNCQVRMAIAGLPPKRRRKLERFHLELQTSLSLLSPEERLPHLILEMATNLKDMQLRVHELCHEITETIDL